jgi:hypothetical protein
MIFLVALVILIFIAAGGQAVLHLWNWLLPPLFGFKAITFWQAVGILALCRLLFGGFGGFGRSGNHCRERMQKRRQNMTPEEREKFRQGMRGRCGFGAETPATESKA